LLAGDFCRKTGTVPVTNRNIIIHRRQKRGYTKTVGKKGIRAAIVGFYTIITIANIVKNAGVVAKQQRVSGRIQAILGIV